MQQTCCCMCSLCEVIHVSSQQKCRTKRTTSCSVVSISLSRAKNLFSFFIDSAVINQCWESLPSFVFISQTSLAVTTHTHTSLHLRLDLSPTDRDFLSVSASFSPPIESKHQMTWYRTEGFRTLSLEVTEVAAETVWSVLITVLMDDTCEKHGVRHRQRSNNHFRINYVFTFTFVCLFVS